MNKRGAEIAINPLIMIALGVLVLVILVVVFKDQLTGGSKKYDAISKQAVLDDSECSFLMGRKCADSCEPGKSESQADSTCTKPTSITTDGAEKKQVCCKT